MFDWKDESLPEGRKVKTIMFPVRHLTSSDIESRQEYENVTLSGTISNASPYTLTGVRMDVILFFAGDVAARKIAIETLPSTLTPSDSATFELTEIVEDPVARIELHPVWDK
jgi:hypothetical protein